VRIQASRLLLSAALIALLPLSACRSDHVEITIQNQTGAAIHLLEVDYPSASFGAETLAAGAAFHYRIQVQGDGQVTVTYSDSQRAQPHITGPSLTDRQQGSLEILLLPGGKAEFHPQFAPHH
jgi:hypothetical protein